MKDILDELIKSLSNGNILLGIVIIAIAFIFNYKKIVMFLEERKKARIGKLIEALKCEYVTGLTKEHLQDELVTEYFKITTGIRLEKQFREAVIQAHKSTNGEISFAHFKRSLPHLFFENNSLRVEISQFEKASYWFNLVFGFILAALGLVLSILPSQVENINFLQILVILGTGLFFIVTSLFMLLQTFPVASARKIEKLLINTRKTD